MRIFHYYIITLGFDMEPRRMRSSKYCDLCNYCMACHLIRDRNGLLWLRRRRKKEATRWSEFNQLLYVDHEHDFPWNQTLWAFAYFPVICQLQTNSQFIPMPNANGGLVDGWRAVWQRRGAFPQRDDIHEEERRQLWMTMIDGVFWTEVTMIIVINV